MLKLLACDPHATGMIQHYVFYVDEGRIIIDYLLMIHVCTYATSITAETDHPTYVYMICGRYHTSVLQITAVRVIPYQYSTGSCVQYRYKHTHVGIINTYQACGSAAAVCLHFVVDAVAAAAAAAAFVVRHGTPAARAVVHTAVLFG